MSDKTAGGQTGEAFFTLVTSQDYCVGAVVLAHSLAAVNTKKRDLVCMVTEDVAEEDRKVLEGAGMKCVEVEKIPSPVPSGQEQWDQCGFTKLNLWRQCQYNKIFYIDADCLVVKSLDHVFDRETSFAAAPDTFPPDKFNAGVLFLKPSEEVFKKMQTSMSTLQSYDGGDTGFLNAFFPHWYTDSSDCRLSFGYNALRTMQWMTKAKPGYWNAVEPIHCIHFCSFPKPWDQAPTGPLEQRWWVQFAQSQIALKMKGLNLLTSTGRKHKAVQDKIEEKRKAEEALPPEVKLAKKRGELFGLFAVLFVFIALFGGLAMLMPNMGKAGRSLPPPEPPMQSSHQSARSQRGSGREL